MRQELIEKAVDLMGGASLHGLSELGYKMTEQERRYAIGVIEDKRDDALNAVMWWTERQAVAMRRKADRAAKDV